MSPFRILGIDPGTNVLGYAVIDSLDDDIQVQAMDIVNMRQLATQQEKLLHIYQAVAKIILKYRPAEMAVEAPFYGKNVQSMLKLGRAQGVAIAAALTREVKVIEYSPKKIKMAITGNGNAGKDQVAAMLGHLVQGDVTAGYFDATDALATAVCHAQQGRVRISGQKHYGSWKAFAKENPDIVSGQ